MKLSDLMRRLSRLSVRTVKALLRQPFVAPLLALWVVAQLKPLDATTGGRRRKGALRLLAFSSERWSQDLSAISQMPDVEILKIPTRVVELVNAIFEDRFARIDSLLYYRTTDPHVLAARRRQYRGVQRVFSLMQRMADFDCAITCAFKYVREAPWAAAGRALNIPFVALHKEFTVMEPRFLEQRIAEQKSFGFKFLGTHLCVVSDTARRLLVGAEACEPACISVVGLMRADNLFRPWQKAPNERPSVVLFSFGTLTGPFQAPLPMRSPYFSSDPAIGFTELFRDVHLGFVELALKHPEVDFLIKPKNIEDWWNSEIEETVSSHLGRRLQDISNCRIVAESAPELMRRSCANIVLNSTVVIESRILGCNTILPVFAEAAGRHADMVHFRDYLDLFAVASSKQDLIDKLEQALAGETLTVGSSERLHEFLVTQIGNPDGRSARRFVDVLRAQVETCRKAPA